jgi:hypothetical protein
LARDWHEFDFVDSGYVMGFYLNIIYKCQIMSLMVVQDSLHLNESQMYDHLSLFIQIFKKLIASVENTAISLQKATDHIPFLDKIQSSLD